MIHQNLAYKEDLPAGVLQFQDCKIETGNKCSTFMLAEESSQEITRDVLESSENGQLLPYENHIDLPSNESIPSTEEDLIVLTRRLYDAASSGIIITYWRIGNNINAFYQKDYGSGKLKKISEATGIHVDSLHKACKFARQFSREKLNQLISGRFIVSWTMIANNLTVDSSRFLESYGAATTPTELNNTLMNLKKATKRNGHPRPVNDESENSGSAQETMQEADNGNGDDLNQLMNEPEDPGIQNVDEAPGLNDEVKGQPDLELNLNRDNTWELPIESDVEVVSESERSEGIAALNEALDDLRREIDEKNNQISRLSEQVEGMKQMIEDKDWRLNALKNEAEELKRNFEERQDLDEITSRIEEILRLVE